MAAKKSRKLRGYNSQFSANYLRCLELFAKISVNPSAATDSDRAEHGYLRGWLDNHGAELPR